MPGNMEGYLTVRLDPDSQDATIQYMKTVWDNFTSAYPFVYYYLDKDRRDHYTSVQETGRIFTLLSAVTLLMAGLGLFALYFFLYSRRQRDVGIQKAMGASNLIIILRKVGEVVSMVMAASIAAWIGVYYLVQAWFKDYAYHVDVNMLYFIAASMIVILFSLATVYYHTLLTARINPGTVLKDE
jgi:putative ABC transport system permease protein